MPKITFLPSRRTCDVAEGLTILQASEIHHIGLSSCCGGQALCTTCRVRVEEGVENLSDIGDHEFDMLYLLQLGSSIRLGCQTKIHGDVVVRIPG